MKDNNTEALNNLNTVLQSSDSIYESTSVIAKRAKQVLEDRRESFYAELESIGVINADDNVGFNKENWRDAVYIKYENRKKPLTQAIEDIAEEKVMYRYIGEDDDMDDIF